MAVRNRSSNQLTNLHYKMAENGIKKCCSRCEGIFYIPKTYKSRAQDILIMYTPCPHCGYVKDIANPKYNRSGRCKRCSIPFKIVNHHGKGMCMRCHRAYLRDKS